MTYRTEGKAFKHASIWVDNPFVFGYASQAQFRQLTHESLEALSKENKADRHKSRAHNSTSRLSTFKQLKNAKKKQSRTDRQTVRTKDWQSDL